MNSTLRNSIIITLLMILGITGVIVYKERQETQQQFNQFLGEFEYKLTHLLDQLDEVITSEENELESAFNSLYFRISEVDYELSTVNVRVNKHIITYDHRNLLQNMMAMVEGRYTLDEMIINFSKDDGLNEIDLQYLMALKEEVENVWQGLYSEERVKANSTVSIDEFSDTVAPLLQSAYPFELEYFEQYSNIGDLLDTRSISIEEQSDEAMKVILEIANNSDYIFKIYNYSTFALRKT